RSRWDWGRAGGSAPGPRGGGVGWSRWAAGSAGGASRRGAFWGGGPAPGGGGARGRGGGGAGPPPPWPPGAGGGAPARPAAGDAAAIALRVEAALRSDDREAAVNALGAVPESSDLAESAHLWRGRLLKELYRPEEAIDELRACLRLNPRQVEAHRELLIIFGI